jgi:hypothetical protein
MTATAMGGVKVMMVIRRIVTAIPIFFAFSGAVEHDYHSHRDDPQAAAVLTIRLRHQAFRHLKRMLSYRKRAFALGIDLDHRKWVVEGALGTTDARARTRGER